MKLERTLRGLSFLLHKDALFLHFPPHLAWLRALPPKQAAGVWTLQLFDALILQILHSPRGLAEDTPDMELGRATEVTEVSNRGKPSIMCLPLEH